MAWQSRVNALEQELVEKEAHLAALTNAATERDALAAADNARQSAHDRLLAERQGLQAAYERERSERMRLQGEKTGGTIWSFGGGLLTGLGLGCLVSLVGLMVLFGSCLSVLGSGR